MKVLLMTENQNLALLFTHAFQAHSVEVVCAETREEFTYRLTDPGLIALFLDMPDPDDEDLQFWKQLAKNAMVPVLSLSFDPNDVDQVFAWQKAFFQTAFPLTHITKNLAPAPPAASSTDTIELAPGIVFHVGGHCIYKQGECLPLSSIEFKLLYLLSTNLGETFSAQELINRMDLLEMATLYVHIKRLRSKVEENPSTPSVLINRRGQGYCIPGLVINKNERINP